MAVIIDAYPHIDLSLFKIWFKNLTAFQTYAEGEPREKVEEVFAEFREQCFTRSFTANGIRYKASAEVDLCEMQIYGVMFEWKDEHGRKREQHIKVMTRESNLRQGVVRYFVSPCGNLCRKLYFDGYRVFARTDTTKHSYLVQHMSHQARDIRRGAEYNDPSRPYGKSRYKGKLTPYGRRLQKYEEASTALYDGLMGIMSGMASKARARRR